MLKGPDPTADSTRPTGGQNTTTKTTNTHLKNKNRNDINISVVAVRGLSHELVLPRLGHEPVLALDENSAASRFSEC